MGLTLAEKSSARAAGRFRVQTGGQIPLLPPGKKRNEWERA
jgi:hypothetical protein